jgi:predicted RNA-binding protein YlxR (DUF448 family)
MLPKKEMIRVVLTPEGSIEIDETGKKSGRGAYICTDQACVAKCSKSKAVSKNLKHEANTEIYKQIEDEYNRKKQD